MLSPSRMIVLVALVCAEAAGQRLVVQTTTKSASREPVRAQAHLVNIGYRYALPGPVRLPGEVLRGPAFLTPDGKAAIFTVGWPGGGKDAAAGVARRSYVLALGLYPFSPLAGGRAASAFGGRFRAAVAGRDGSTGEGFFGVVGAEPADGKALEGRLSVYGYRPGEDPFFGPLRDSWRLPGLPVEALVLRDEKTICVLCEEGTGGDAVLHVRNAVSGEEIVESRGFLDASVQFGARPGGFALSTDGALVLILTSGYDVTRPAGEAASRLNVLSTENFGAAAEPISLVGEAALGGSTLLAGPMGNWWVATRSPGTDFAYATGLRLTQGRLETVVHVPFAGTTGPLLIAPAPEGPAVAVAVENRLELWPEGKPAGKPVAYATRIGALVWSPEGLFLGEGGRVHRVDPETGRPDRSLQLQEGWVSGILPLPEWTEVARDVDADGLPAAREGELGTSPFMPDSDEDGVSDGLDPEPMVPSPRVTARGPVVFHGEAVGQELKTVVLDTAYARGTAWRLEYSEEEMPWLLAYPREGRLPELDRIFLGVYPALYNPAPGEVLSGTLTLHVGETREAGVTTTVTLSGPVAVARTRKAAAGSPMSFEVRIAPDRNTLRRILWIWEEGEGRPLRGSNEADGLGALADLLAGPPHHFTHREVWGVLAEPLQSFAVVVLGTKAAAHGAMTRQALLDYVAEGGALLLLGAYSDAPELQILLRWLAPIGVHLDASTEVSGRYGVRMEHALTRHWEDFGIREGCAVVVEDPASVLVQGGEDGGYAVLAYRPYGLGRIVVLAARTPLTSGALTRQANRRFASDLFGWLARARQEVYDQDADGLADGTEDRNDNGRVDPGETDHLDADSDGDGIPDSKEDVNRNGWVDAGETSPLLRDSDGDGIDDGADVFPLPPADAPYVGSVDPAEGPSEGGTLVVVRGRNLSPGGTLWFGSRRSPGLRSLDSTRLVAMTPRHETKAGGPVTVRMVNEADGLEGSLPSGFQYTPRSVVTVTLELLEVAQRHYGVYEGRLAVRLECPGAQVSRSTVVVRGEPVEEVTFLVAEDEQAARKAKRRLTGTPIGPGLLRVDLPPGRPGEGLGDAVKVRWEARPKGNRRSVTFQVPVSMAISRNGTALVVESRPLEVRLAGPAVRAAR